jgi:hypothetical protein
MERRVPRAADAYPVTDSSRNEPISSMKQPGEACDVCAWWAAWGCGVVWLLVCCLLGCWAVGG